MKKVLSSEVLKIFGIAALAGICFELIMYFIMGQNLISPSGKIELWSFIINGRESSQQITDWYTPSHIIHGILFYAGYKYFFKFFFKRDLNVWQLLLLTVFTEGSWELLENTDMVINRYREVTIGSEYFGDSVLNSFCDILYCTFGFVMAYKLPTKFVIAFVILAELFVGYMIHDNLILNIIMLLYPLDFIKAWQMAV